MTFYLCNGKNPLCNASAGCHLNGGNCHHTTGETYAKTEMCEDPQHHPERFEAETFPNTSLPTYYFERIPENEEAEE